MSGKVYQLAVEERAELGNGASRRFRRDGKVPVNFYGRGVENKNFVADAKEWASLEKQGARLVELKTETESYQGLIQEIQKDYLKDIVLNLDFKAVKPEEKIRTKVNVKSFGSPVGCSRGGLLEQVAHEVLIECLPKDLPEELNADVSSVDLNQRVHANELVMPEGVVAVDGAKYTVFCVTPTRASRAADAASKK
jgi:large subunit ribosomal protein L25